MAFAFDYSPTRPENIEAILNGLDRYNPETTSVFQEYVAQQCGNQTYDAYANLALLKLYVRDFLRSLLQIPESSDEQILRFLLPDRPQAW